MYIGTKMSRSPSVTDEAILEVLSDTDDCPCRTVPEMADEVELTPDGLRRRLLELEEEGKAVSKHVGARAVVWWLGD